MMKTALVISSFVSASRVGATASAFCLRRLGVETHILPTTLLGRHPGWGPPGGGPMPIEAMQAMWEGIAAQNIPYDAVMTGYMASPAHTALAGDIIKHVKTRNPEAFILVDPVMGDNGRLYIEEATAKAIIDLLCPAADIITPNVWELGFMADAPAANLTQVLAALAKLPASSLVTSVPLKPQIGALLYNVKDGYLMRHEKFSDVPHGGGDALAATFLAHILGGEDMPAAFAKSVSAIFEILSAAVDGHMRELPLVRYQNVLIDQTALPIERLECD